MHGLCIAEDESVYILVAVQIVSKNLDQYTVFFVPLDDTVLSLLYSPDGSTVIGGCLRSPVASRWSHVTWFVLCAFQILATVLSATLAYLICRRTSAMTSASARNGHVTSEIKMDTVQ